jgi:hypothetical protein
LFSFFFVLVFIVFAFVVVVVVVELVLEGVLPALHHRQERETGLFGRKGSAVLQECEFI